jgi:hypothetical protein
MAKRGDTNGTQVAVTRKRLATRAELANPAHRAAVAVDLRQRYEKGASMRRLAHDTGYAYGTVHTLLREAGAVLRTPGRPTEQP